MINLKLGIRRSPLAPLKKGGTLKQGYSLTPVIMRRCARKKGGILRLGWKILMVALATGLGGCPNTARLLEFPLDPGGRSLNSSAAELQPQIADRYLVFVSDRRGSQDILLFDAIDRQLIDLPGLNSLDAIASHPSVSEDGQYIVFQAIRQGRSGVYLYDRQLFQVRNLTDNLSPEIRNTEVRNPVISANGGIIAFEVAINGTWHIYLIDRGGKPLDIPTLPR